MDNFISFQVNSGKLFVADPCYEKEYLDRPGLVAQINNVLNGKWIGGVEYSDEGAWGIRVKSLIAVHFDYYRKSLYAGDYTSVGVDSGQMSIVDFDAWVDGGEYEEGTIYKQVCDATLTDDKMGAYPKTIDDEVRGVASSSGYGDGSYDVFTALNKEGEVVEVRVLFIVDEEDENEEEDDIE